MDGIITLTFDCCSSPSTKEIHALRHFNQFSKDNEFCAQSYKHFTSVHYDSRVIILAIL